MEHDADRVCAELRRQGGILRAHDAADLDSGSSHRA
jgi:hypothetical protein